MFPICLHNLVEIRQDDRAVRLRKRDFTVGKIAIGVEHPEVGLPSDILNTPAERNVVGGGETRIERSNELGPGAKARIARRAVIVEGTSASEEFQLLVEVAGCLQLSFETST